MPQSATSSHEFARLPPWAARLALLAMALALVVLVAVSLGMTEPVRRAGPSDLDTYERVVASLKAGQGYYPALHEALRAGDYGTTSPLNWRMPLFLTLVSAFPTLESAQLFLALVTVLAWLMGIAWAYRSGGTRRAIAVGLALALSLVSIAVYRAELSFELFAGTLILISFVAYGLGWRWIGIAAAALALFTRELAVIYVAGCVVLALRERRWAEIAAWVGIGAAFAGFYAWHAGQAMALLGPDDHAAKVDWLQWGGADFLIRVAGFNGVLLVLPYWAGALALVLGVVGLIRFPRALIAVLGYLALFAVYGRPENSYWGALLAPLLAIGIGLSLPVLADLVRSARWRRSS